MPQPPSNWKRVQTDKAYRDKCVVKSLKMEDANLLFYLAVQQYNQKPTKSRAITIQEIFLGADAIYKHQGVGDHAPAIAIGELNPTDNLQHIGLLGQVYAQVAWYKDLRKEAQSMNCIMRFFTAGARMANAGIFDKVVAAAKLDPNGFSNAVSGAIMPVGDHEQEFAAQGWQNQANLAKAHLLKAGFDVSALGLDNIPTNGL